MDSWFGALKIACMDENNTNALKYTTSDHDILFTTRHSSIILIHSLKSLHQEYHEFKYINDTQFNIKRIDSIININK